MIFHPPVKPELDSKPFAGKRALCVCGGPFQLALIRTASQLGIRTIVADISSEAAARELADVFVQIDTNDRDALLMIAKQNDIDLVLSDQTDRVVPIVAHLNAAMDLPGLRPEVAKRFTNKLEMRSHLSGSEVRLPHFAETDCLEHANQIAEQFGYPIVVKPKQSQSSQGVFRVERACDLPNRFMMAMSFSSDKKILIEEYVDGPEVTVEGLMIKGTLHLLAIGDIQHYTSQPCVARQITYPSRLSPTLRSRLRTAMNEAVKALGLEDGLCHAEFRIREERPYLIEIAARGGGNHIASLILPHLTDLDVYRIWIGRLFNQDIEFPKPKCRAACLEWLSLEPGRVKSISDVDHIVRENLAAVVQLHFRVGDMIRHPRNKTERAGYYVVLGNSREDVDNRSNQVRKLVKVSYN